jgi:hypothetical protein
MFSDISVYIAYFTNNISYFLMFAYGGELGENFAGVGGIFHQRVFLMQYFILLALE